MVKERTVMTRQTGRLFGPLFMVLVLPLLAAVGECDCSHGRSSTLNGQQIETTVEAQVPWIWDDESREISSSDTLQVRVLKKDTDGIFKPVGDVGFREIDAYYHYVRGPYRWSPVSFHDLPGCIWYEKEDAGTRFANYQIQYRIKTESDSEIWKNLFFFETENFYLCLDTALIVLEGSYQEAAEGCGGETELIVQCCPSE